MAKLQISMDNALKTAAEKVIAELGLTPEAAITLLYKQIVEHGKIPFPIEQTENSKLAQNVQRLSEDLPVRRLDTDEKINEWIMEEE